MRRLVFDLCVFAALTALGGVLGGMLSSARPAETCSASTARAYMPPALTDVELDVVARHRVALAEIVQRRNFRGAPRVSDCRCPGGDCLCRESGAPCRCVGLPRK